MVIVDAVGDIIKVTPTVVYVNVMVANLLKTAWPTLQKIGYARLMLPVYMSKTVKTNAIVVNAIAIVVNANAIVVKHIRIVNYIIALA